MKNIAVFASGRGSNFRKIYENIQKGLIPARISCLITDKEKAGAIEFAKKNGIASYIIPPGNYPNQSDFGNALLNILEKSSAQWIVLAGYLKKIPENVVRHYSNRMVNIHPALLPAFGGKGMYGHHVHEAVFRSGAKLSGVTVHLVNEVYDSGPIVLQEAVDISRCQNPEEIAEEVLKVEHRLYSEALQKLFTRDFKVISNRVVFSIGDH